MRRGTFGLLVILIGCASAGPAVQPDSGSRPGGRVVFECAADCSTEWARAEAWVTRHARLKVLLSGDTLIHTATQDRPYPIYQFVLTRSATGQGGAISLALTCGNRLGCRPSADAVRNALRQFLLTGVDSLPAQSRLSGIRD